MFKAIDFISASTAGVVRVMAGFDPDAAVLYSNYDGTNPDIYVWHNPKYKGSGATTGWAAALSLKLTGSTGVVTRDTTGITLFDGGTEIAADETNNTDPKHIDYAGVAAKKGDVTRDGISIPADHQVASGRNLLWLLKEDGARFGS